MCVTRDCLFSVKHWCSLFNWNSIRLSLIECRRSTRRRLISNMFITKISTTRTAKPSTLHFLSCQLPGACQEIRLLIVITAPVCCWPDTVTKDSLVSLCIVQWIALFVPKTPMFDTLLAWITAWNSHCPMQDKYAQLVVLSCKLNIAFRERSFKSVNAFITYPTKNTHGLNISEGKVWGRRSSIVKDWLIGAPVYHSMFSVLLRNFQITR